jgi:hypothetical protein
VLATGATVATEADALDPDAINDQLDDKLQEPGSMGRIAQINCL